jgi:cyclopropane fatty-acyl-phospholipid synthase-like methyltransferase
MAHDGVKEGHETAPDDDAARGNQFDGIDYLKRFSKLIERGKTILDVGCGDGLPVDEYLVKQGFAANGIDVSARLIELARKNVPEGFYEVKDMFDLEEGEYCVDGVVSLRAMLHIPYESYCALLKRFASFMPNGGALLLSMRADYWRQDEEVDRRAMASCHRDGVGDNTELVEDAGFTIMLNGIDGQGDKKHQIILARS